MSNVQMKNGLGYNYRKNSKTSFIDIEAAVTSEPEPDMQLVLSTDDLNAIPGAFGFQ